MSEEWVQTTLGAATRIKQGRYLSKAEMAEAQSIGAPIPVHGANGSIGWTSKPLYTHGVPLVTCRGSNCGMVLWADGPLWVSNNAMAILPEENFDLRFLYFHLLNSPPYEFVSGSAQPQITMGDLSKKKLTFPPLPEQRTIAATLGALDDKIELNRKMNETLESMARALFRDWFVDFGPTRAKAEGREPYLAPEVWDLFPDRLDEEGKPEGWTNDQLGTFTNIKNGFAFKSKDWRETGTPVVKIGSVKPAFVDLNQVSFIADDLAIDRKAFRLAIGDMLVGLTGYVGETGRVPPTKNCPMLNQRVGKIEPQNGLNPFVFAGVRLPEFKKFAESKGHGSAQANVSSKDLLTYPLSNPGECILGAFCKITAPFFEKSLANMGESRTLAQIRDLLLPKLMSGEIRVRDAEKAVEAVA